ncbi:MAG: D-alanyl-D-alanine carboxypeptidase/D-alanyl-D-alanine-endopeptidase [Acidobacteriota bacterium]
MMETRKRLAFVALVLALAVLPVFSGCNTDSRAQQAAPAKDERAQTSKNLAQLTRSSGAASDKEIASALDKLFDNSELAPARWGVFVISLRDQRTVYSRNADALFTPASNMKLFPTGVALELLGADYRWRTSVYAATQPDSTGTINGDLILYGRGAPDLSVQTGKEGGSSLTQLADDLYNQGVRRLKGKVIGDESYFRGEALGDGWQWNDLQWYFGAEASALTINNNEVDITILPPDKAVAPPLIHVTDATGYVSVENKMALVDGAGRMTVGIHRGLSDNVVRVWGTFPAGSKGFGARLSVHRPALWAARLFLQALKARGVVIEGDAQTVDSRQPPNERFDPSKAVELAFASSKPLSEIAKETNKGSINLYAELILRTLGRERGSLIATSETAGRERGDDETGLAVIRLWLGRAGVSTEGLAFHDGSGLSRLDLISPKTFVGLLSVISQRGTNQVFRETLPLSGRDGTLGGRLSDLTDRVSAKTGSLTYDTALSGYLARSDGEVLAFSIICNDHTARLSSTRTIDQVVSILATSPPSFSPKSGK